MADGQYGPRLLVIREDGEGYIFKMDLADDEFRGNGGAETNSSAGDCWICRLPSAK
jgi:hypothetical protein